MLVLLKLWPQHSPRLCQLMCYALLQHAEDSLQLAKFLGWSTSIRLTHFLLSGDRGFPTLVRL